MQKWLLLSLLFVGSVFGQTTRPAWYDLKPLSKPHYPWGIPHSWLNAPDEDLRNILRICGAGAIQVQYMNDAVLKRTVGLLNDLQLPLAIQFSPWGAVTKKSDPGQIYTEIARFAQACDKIREHGIRVPVVSFDDENYTFGTPEEMSRHRRTLYELSKHYFPAATVDWYAHGAIRPDSSDSGWSEPAYQLGKDLPTDYLSTSLYKPGELEVQRMSIRKTVAAAGEKNIVIYLSLGSGYKPQFDVLHAWDDAWDYDLIYDRLFGRELNGIDWFSKRPERYAPYNRVAYVMLYPPPSKSPIWMKHFIAYVEGAQR